MFAMRKTRKEFLRKTFFPFFFFFFSSPPNTIHGCTSSIWRKRKGYLENAITSQPINLINLNFYYKINYEEHTMSRSHISMEGSIDPTARKFPANIRKVCNYKVTATRTKTVFVCVHKCVYVNTYQLSTLQKMVM